MWMTAGIGPAIACVLLAALGYGAVFLAERAQANANTDRERYYEPLDDAMSPLAAEAEYGWPSPNGAVETPAAR
jgi:hypothetical protein